MSSTSKNPNTNTVYKIPNSNCDKKNIDAFLAENADKKIIVVQGLGFVGAVMSLVCANSDEDEYAVIGVDLATSESYWKIGSLNDGVFPLIAEDKQINVFFNKAKEKNNFFATFDEYAYEKADVVIVDINLDVQKENNEDNVLVGYDVSLSGFKKGIEAIAKNCKENCLVLIETTVPPGTTKYIAEPIFKQKFKERDINFNLLRLGHSYERVMPGPDYIDSIKNFPRVYSGINSESADAIEEFLKTIIDSKNCKLTRLKNTNSTEMAKVLENSYRAMNISFIVEWSRFAEEAEVDLYSVINAIKDRETHKNIMLPGLGVGGYCLTKDPLLASWSKQNIFHSKTGLNLSEKSVSINDQMPKAAFSLLERTYERTLSNTKIGLLGVSYRGDVGDTRYSPVQSLYELLYEAGAEISLHDPYVNFWEEVNMQVERDIDKFLNEKLDLLIVSTGHSFYKEPMAINKILDMNKLTIFDTIGIFNEMQLAKLKEIHKVILLGSGE